MRIERTVPRSSRTVGTLVHRLVQRIGFEESGRDSLCQIARHLVRSDEFEGDGVEQIVDAAADAYQAICARGDVRAIYAAGRVFHEVPFTMSLDGRIVRGTIDCLVETSPGVFTLLEFKTGRERLEDRHQIELYLHATRQLFPGSSIDARVVYAAGGSVFVV